MNAKRREKKGKTCGISERGRKGIYCIKVNSGWLINSKDRANLRNEKIKRTDADEILI